MTVAELGARVVTTEIGAPASPVRALRRMVTPVRAELTVIFRAIAILTVVALHYNVGSIWGGTTILGRDHDRAVSAGGIFDGASPAAASAVGGDSPPHPDPACANCGDHHAGDVRHPAHESTGWRAISTCGAVFYTNFIDFTDPVISAGGTIWLWFIAAYVQILLILAAALTALC